MPLDQDIIANLRRHIGRIGEVSAGEKLRQKTREEEIQDALRLYEGKSKIQSERGGVVSIVDPNTGEVKNIYAPGVLGGGKGKVIRKPTYKPPELTQKKLEEVGSITASEVGEEYPLPEQNIMGKIAARLTPWATKLEAERTGVEETREAEIKTRMKPFEQQFKTQFTGQPLQAAEAAVEEDALPDPAEYDENTIIEDENGNKYQLQNGKWQPV